MTWYDAPARSLGTYSPASHTSASRKLVVDVPGSPAKLFQSAMSDSPAPERQRRR